MRDLKNLLLAFSILLLSFWLLFKGPQKIVEKELEPSYDSAVKNINRHCYENETFQPNNVQVVFDDSVRVTECKQRTFSYSIYVNPKFWFLMTEATRYRLMYLAVAQCVLGDELNDDSGESLYIFLYKYQNYLRGRCTLWKPYNN